MTSEKAVYNRDQAVAHEGQRISVSVAAKIVGCATTTAYGYLKAGYDSVDKMIEFKAYKDSKKVTIDDMIKTSPYGRLTVLGEAPRRGKAIMLWCACSCGVEKEIHKACVQRGETVSCGCYKKEKSTFKNGNKNGKRMPNPKHTFRQWYCTTPKKQCAKYDYCLWVIDFKPFNKDLPSCFKESLDYYDRILYKKLITQEIDKVLSERESVVY